MELIKEMCLTAGFTLWLFVVLFVIGMVYDRRCWRHAAPAPANAEHHAGRVRSVRFWLGVLEDPDATEVERLVARELLDAHFDQNLVARGRRWGPRMTCPFTRWSMPLQAPTPPRRGSLRMRLALAVLGRTAALVLSGCGAGQMAATRQQGAQAIDGSNGGVGPMLVRNVVLSYPENGTNFYPEGADAPLELVIVNEGNQPDTLVSVSTPAAREVLIQGNTQIPSGTAFTVIKVDEPHTSPILPVPPLPLPRPQQPSAPAAPEADSSIRLGFGELRIVLIDLIRPIRAGESVPVTFLFRNAGEVTVPVPIANSGFTREEIPRTPGPAEESPWSEQGVAAE